MKSVLKILIEHRMARPGYHLQPGPGIDLHLVPLILRPDEPIVLAGDEQYLSVVLMGILDEAVGQIALLIEVLAPEHGAGPHAEALDIHEELLRHRSLQPPPDLLDRGCGQIEIFPDLLPDFPGDSG